MACYQGVETANMPQRSFIPRSTALLQPTLHLALGILLEGDETKFV